MVEADVCLKASGLSKKFARSLKRSFVYGAHDLLADALGRAPSTALRPSEFWALWDVSFTLRRGQSLGIIGLNGSGKTTLLRTVCGILLPTAGTSQVNGRIAPLLALGAGFKPVLSGRENIFLNLSLLGVTRLDIQRLFDSIVEFAELSEAIDAPLGTYSSGMKARLGFACAVHTNPSILVVDEVLSVGDTKFRAKCRNKINELRKTGTSMLLVSHSSISVEALCDECLYLVKGRVAALGNPADVLKMYEADNVRLAASKNQIALTRHTASIPLNGGQALCLRDVRFTAPGASNSGLWHSGRRGEVAFMIDCARCLDEVSVNLMITDLTHHPGEVVQFIVSMRDIGWLRLDAGQTEVTMTLPPVGLRQGTYRVKVSVSQGTDNSILDAVDDMKLVVHDVRHSINCLYFQSREWRVAGASVTGVPALPDTADLEEAEDF